MGKNTIPLLALLLSVFSIQTAHHKRFWPSLRNNKIAPDELNKINSPLLIQVEPARIPTIFENTSSTTAVFTLNSLQTNSSQKITLRPHSAIRFPVNEYTDQIVVNVDDDLFIHRITKRFSPRTVHAIVLMQNGTGRHKSFNIDIIENE